MAATSSACSSVNPPHGRSQPRDEIISLTGSELERMTILFDKHCAAVCQIIIKDQPDLKGTGILIGGRLLITNHHVIRNEEMAKRAVACFRKIVWKGYPEKYPVLETIPIELDAEHCFITHPNKEKRLLGQTIPEPADRNHLDFTIVGLQSHPYLFAMQQRAYSIFTTTAYQQGDPVYVIHYPDIHELRGPEISTWRIRKVTPYSLHYGPMATSGSSGAGVTNEHGLIALHYYKDTLCEEGCEGTRPCFAAVRIDKIADCLLRSSQRKRIEGLITDYQGDPYLAIKAHIAEFYHKTSARRHGEEDWFFPIKDVYTELVIIGEQEREEKQMKGKTFHDRRIPAHETLYQPKTPIKIGELFNPRKKIRDNQEYLEEINRIIVYGAAGVGKTTFSEMAAMHVDTLWGGQFKMVFLIKLRNIDEFRASPLYGDCYTFVEVFAKAYDIVLNPPSDLPSDKFGVSFQELSDFLKQDFIKKTTLFILDGFDELSSKINNDRSPFRNIFGELSAHVDHILVTSRPGTVKFTGVEMGFQEKFEIIGFDEENIRKYTNKFYHHPKIREQIHSQNSAEKEAQFLAILESRPILRNLVQIPISLTLACSIFIRKLTVFDSKNYCLTNFYIDTVDDLYQRFFQKSEIPACYANERAFRQDIDKLLETLAWKAVKEDTIQITERMISILERENRFIKKTLKKVSMNDLKNVGLIKGNKSSWEFIHPTFQEYFAACYLANLYLDKELEMAIQELRKIKFNPQYTLILRFVVGYLSDTKSDTAKGDEEALLAFFRDLFESPRDLAISYELRLFAQCFEECEKPEDVPQYSNFVNNCAKYIDNIETSEDAIFNLLNRNNKLLFQISILDTIQSHITDRYLAKKMVGVVNRTAFTGQALPLTLVETLGSIVKVLIFKASLLTISSEESRNTIKKVIDTLGTIAKREGMMPGAAISILLGIVKNTTLDDIREKAAQVLGRISQSEGIKCEVVINTMVEMVKSATLDEHSRIRIAEDLGMISLPEGRIFEAAMDALVKMFRDIASDEYVRSSAADAIGLLAQCNGTIPQSVICVLPEIIKRTAFCKYTKLCEYTRRRAVKALEKIAQHDGAISESVINALVENVKDINGEARTSTVQALGKIAQHVRTVPKTVINALEEILKESFLDGCAREARALNSIDKQNEMTSKLTGADRINIITVVNSTKREAAEALVSIARQGGSIPETALSALVKTTKDVSLEVDIRVCAAEALGSITRQGGMIPGTVTSTLLEIVSNVSFAGNVRIRISVAETLVTIAQLGGMTLGIAINIFVETIKDAILRLGNRELVARALGKIAQDQWGGAILEPVIGALTEIVKDVSLDVDVRVSVAKILGMIAHQGGSIIGTTIKALVKTVKDTSLNEIARIGSIFALTMIALQGRTVFEIVISALAKITRDANLDGNARISSVYALVTIVQNQRGEAIPEPVIGALVEIVKDATFDGSIRIGVACALAAIAKQERATLETASRALLEIVKDANLYGDAISAVAYVLEIIVQSKGTISEIAIGPLLEIVKSATFDGTTRTRDAGAERAVSETDISALVELIKKLIEKERWDEDTREIGAKILNTMAQQPRTTLSALILKDPILSRYATKEQRVAEALLTIAQQEGTLPGTALSALVEMLKDPMLSRYARERVANALMIAQRGRMVSETIILALVKIIKDPKLDEYTIARAIYALGTIVHPGGTIAISVLLAMLEDATLHEHTRLGAARVLGTIVVQWEKTMPDAAIEALVEMVKDSASPMSTSAAQVLGTIVENGAQLSRITLRLLVDESKTTNLQIKDPIIDILTKISPNSLLQVITKDIEALQQVIQICHITQKALIIVNGRICISDQREQVSIRLPDGVDTATIAPIDLSNLIQNSSILFSSSGNPATMTFSSSSSAPSSSFSSSSSSSSSYSGSVFGYT